MALNVKDFDAIMLSTETPIFDGAPPLVKIAIALAAAPVMQAFTEGMSKEGLPKDEVTKFITDHQCFVHEGLARFCFMAFLKAQGIDGLKMAKGDLAAAAKDVEAFLQKVKNDPNPKE